MEQHPSFDIDQADAAVAARLHRLRSRPVDLTCLRSAIETEIPRVQRRETRFLFRMGGLRGAAAVFLLLSFVLVLVLGSLSGPAYASSERLLRLHQEVSSMTHPVHEVNSWEAAETVVEQQWPTCPDLPTMPGEAIRCCCVQRMGMKKVACVSMIVDGKPVTMAVANAGDVKSPASNSRNGDYNVQSRNGVNMVMTISNSRWVCFMGEHSADRLLELARTLKTQ
jgi:hypothetical protein